MKSCDSLQQELPQLLGFESASVSGQRASMAPELGMLQAAMQAGCGLA